MDGTTIRWAHCNKMDNIESRADSLLEFIACSCKKSKCTTNVCKCRKVNLKCTDLCDCTSCENQKEDQSDDEFGNDSSDGEHTDNDEQEDLEIS